MSLPPRGTRGAFILLAALFILRAPGLVFGVVDIDESDFLVAGRMLGAHALPYVDIVEKKPLLSYLFYSPAALFGFHMWPMQVVAIFWVLATCLVVGRAAFAWTGRDDVARLAPWLCAAACSCNVLSVNAELMLNLPAAAALYFFIRAERDGRARDALFAGLCLGAAMLFKHQAGILLVSLGGALIVLAARRRRMAPIGRALLLGTGASLPWAAAIALYAGLGHLDAFIEWNLVRNFLYSGFGAGSALARFAEGVALMAVLAVPVHWLLAIRATRHFALEKSSSRDPIAFALIASLWATWIPVCLGGRFYPHYFLQFAPVLSLVAASELASLWASEKMRRLVTVGVALPVATFFAIAVGRGLAKNYPGQEPRARELGAWLRNNTRPDERLFIWGHFTPIYFHAQRLPGTRYYNTSVHMGDFDPGHLADGFDLRPFVSTRDVQATLSDLETNRPAIFVDTSPADIHHWSRVPLASFPELKAYLDSHYIVIAHAGGAAISRRRDSPEIGR